MTNNDIELTVEKIDKFSIERRVALIEKSYAFAQCGLSVIGAALMIPVSLPAVFAFLFMGFTAKLVFSSSKDLVIDKTVAIDKLKSTITYEDYRKYNKSKIKIMNRSGFAPSSTTKK